MSLFDEVFADVKALPAEEQERVAEAVLAFMHLREDAIGALL
jgi:hypothetical protein